MAPHIALSAQVAPSLHMAPHIALSAQVAPSLHMAPHIGTVALAGSMAEFHEADSGERIFARETLTSVLSEKFLLLTLTDGSLDSFDLV